MAYEQFITLVPYLKAVPDKRDARGRRYELWVILIILAVALLSGQKTIWGMVQWAGEHGCELVAALQLPRKRLPSRSTFYLTLRNIGIEGLEQQLAAMATAIEWENRASEVLRGADGQPLRGLAVDGKDVRGARRHGQPAFLVSLVGHGDGVVLGQQRVDSKTNEITVVPKLLATRDLHGMVVTMDALLTQRSLAHQIMAQGGDYLMVVKKNQAALWNDIDYLFQAPPLCKGEDDRLMHVAHAKSHGRLETRTLETSAKLSEYVDWPGSRQVLRRSYRTVNPNTGAIFEDITYGVTSLSRTRAQPKHLAALRRGHWTIENRVHYVRDETLGEDRCQMHCGNAPQALAALRNAVLNILRYQGYTSIPEGIRHYGASLHNALSLLGVPAL